MEIDYSELSGKNFRCIDECGLCCTFQPELSREEYGRLKGDPAAEGSLQVKSDSGRARYFFALKNERGSCAFLNNRRCKIYDKRLAMCRQFPFQIYAGENIQINGILSCRGMWISNSQDAISAARDTIAGYGKKNLEAELAKTKKKYAKFRRDAGKAGVFMERAELAAIAKQIIPNITDRERFSQLISYINSEKTPLDGYDDAQIQRDINSSAPDEDPSEFALDIIKRQFKREDVPELPTYATAGFEWRNLSLNEEESEIIESSLDDDGTIKPVRKTPIGSAKLHALGRESAKALTDYLQLLNNREKTYGDAAYLIAPEFSQHIVKAYLYVIATHAASVWSRANIFAAMDGAAVSEHYMKEAIVSYDSEAYSPKSLGAVI